MTLKLYVYDRGWAGADVAVTTSLENAIALILQPSIDWWKEADLEHEKAHPERDNPWKRKWQLAESNPEKYIDTYEIRDGLVIETAGE